MRLAIVVDIVRRRDAQCNTDGRVVPALHRPLQAPGFIRLAKRLDHSAKWHAVERGDNPETTVCARSNHHASAPRKIARHPPRVRGPRHHQARRRPQNDARATTHAAPRPDPRRRPRFRPSFRCLLPSLPASPPRPLARSPRARRWAVVPSLARRVLPRPDPARDASRSAWWPTNRRTTTARQSRWTSRWRTSSAARRSAAARSATSSRAPARANPSSSRSAR